MAEPGRIRDIISLGAVLALIVGVSFLPPDTSLREIERAGALRACVPPSYAPLVTGVPERPGVDIELLQLVAKRIGVSLVINENRAMGRDFNPRNWGLNRAQCQVIAGGVVDSNQTRSFLETGPAYAQTGWAVVSTTATGSLQGKRIGVLTLISGLDRLGLASFLRAQGATARILVSPEALVAGIADGTLDAGVTEAMLASRLAADNDWKVAWAPPELARYNLVFGLWKGDITLKRVIDQTFAELIADGTIAAIMQRYGVAPIN